MSWHPNVTRRRRPRPSVLLACALALVGASVFSAGTSSAQEAPAASAAPATISPTGHVEQVQVRSVDGSTPVAAPSLRQPAPRIPGDAAAYAAAKQQATQSLAKPGAAAGPAAAAAPSTLRGFEGMNQNDTIGFRPPDNDGAQGNNQYLQVVNSNVRVFNTKANPPTIVSTKSLNTLMGYGAQSLFDPRALYDPVFKRWIIVADAFAESATTQLVFVAVSRTSKANGAYWVYAFDRGGSSSAETFFDFPQLGQDQDAVLITGTQFPNNGNPARAEFFCFSKARMYNGLNIGSQLFGNLEPTLAPPNVLDSSATDVLMAAPNGSGNLVTYRATGCGRSPTTLTQPSPIAVSGGYAVPPNAHQPGTSALLDTIDNRFVNRSTQYGNSLWNVHTKALGSFPAPQWYEVNIGSNTIAQKGLFFASGTSDDWNASVAARPDGRVYFAWSSTDQGAGVNPQVRFTSRTIGTPANSTDNNAGISVFTSPTFYHPTSDVPERWGDYSGVALDDANATRAYLVVEKVNSSSVWGSWIAQVSGG